MDCMAGLLGDRPAKLHRRCQRNARAIAAARGATRAPSSSS
jgi:hypothetical protein